MKLIIQIPYFNEADSLPVTLAALQLSVAGCSIVEWPSGFRAMTRDVALRLSVFNSYTYTLETIIQAGRSNIRALSVPIRTNPDTQPSRLVKSVSNYVMRSLGTIVRIFAMYRPMLFFWILWAIFMLAGLVAGVRFLVYVAIGQGNGHIQSVTFTALYVILEFLLFMLGFLAYLMATNRRLLERIEWRVRPLESRPFDAKDKSCRK